MENINGSDLENEEKKNSGLVDEKTKKTEKYAQNSVIDGTVTGIAKFGAFVSLPDGRNGLIHISEISNRYVKDVSDYLKVGQKVNVLVIEDSGSKISLSLKRIPNASGGVNLDRMINKFMKESNEAQMDLSGRLERNYGN